MLPSPAFIIDREKLKTNLNLLRAAKEAAGIELLFALKGFALPALMPDILSVADAVSASSLNEALFGHMHSRKPVHLYAPAYRPEDVPVLIPITGTWIFNSLEAYHRWQTHLPESIEIGLRVNPHYGHASADIYNPGRPGSRLGVAPSATQYPLPPRISGLHVHTLCEAGAEAFSTLIEALLQQFAPWLAHIRWLNLGGGHLITRTGYNLALFLETIKRLKQRLPHIERISIEPSAAFVWEAGTLVSEILDITETAGRRWAMLDVSFTAHMPDTLEMPYRPIVREALPEINPTFPTYWLGGVTCLAGDEMGPYSFPQPLEVGQRITFHDMAHYTFVKTTMFNGVAHPSLIVMEKGGFRIVKTFGFEDYVRRLSNG
ncbi:MAG: carboxynorspermidine decarboxylase [Bacteroidia bacterium]|nr:carboxynorspermidine decarboxylase [Bacteroidia bacterium]MCX7651488.1 carboxynorspermidine decarboxylase [Bacteroidia bacterium]MDW8416757.1 carboxynorspermidine decarboxylase [Bacteroidia bacterium]